MGFKITVSLQQPAHRLCQPVLIVVGAGDHIRGFFYRIGGVSHGDAAACGLQHGDIVLRVSGGVGV